MYMMARTGNGASLERDWSELVSAVCFSDPVLLFTMIIARAVTMFASSLKGATTHIADV